MSIKCISAHFVKDYLVHICWEIVSTLAFYVWYVLLNMISKIKPLFSLLLLKLFLPTLMLLKQ